MFFGKITCWKSKNALSLQCDFFIVLDLRLTKIGWQACQPFAFYSGCIIFKNPATHRSSGFRASKSKAYSGM